MEKLHRTFIQLEAKGLSGDGAGSLEGYASVKGSVDAYGDTIIDGAYVELEALVRDGFVTFGHENRDLPVAYLTEAREDARGLWVKAIFHDTPDAQNVRQVCQERMKAGKSVGLSIDYYPVKWSWEEKDGKQVRILEEIKVVGFAVVNVPAERLAEMTAIKASGRPNEEQFKSLLAELEDWTTREEWIAENRRHGLSASHQERIAAVKSRLESLIREKTEAEPEDTPASILLELEMARALLGA